MAMNASQRDAVTLLVGTIVVGVGSSILHPEIVSDLPSAAVTVVCSLVIAAILLPLVQRPRNG